MKNSDYNVDYTDDGYVIISGKNRSSTIKRLEFDNKRLIRSVLINTQEKDYEYKEIILFNGIKIADLIFDYKSIPPETVLEFLFELDEKLFEVIKDVNKKLKSRKDRAIPIAKLDENFIDTEKYKIPNDPDQIFKNQGKHFKEQVEEFINKQDEAFKLAYKKIKDQDKIFEGRRPEYYCDSITLSPITLPQIFCQFCSKINPLKCFIDIIERDGSIPSKIIKVN